VKRERERPLKDSISMKSHVEITFQNAGLNIQVFDISLNGMERTLELLTLTW
jgi:Tfp pilus assembly PilM family ATPase